MSVNPDSITIRERFHAVNLQPVLAVLFSTGSNHNLSYIMQNLLYLFNAMLLTCLISLDIQDIRIRNTTYW